MPRFTIETTYRLPVYRQRSYEAETLEEACRLAVEDDDWSEQKEDYESSGETYATGPGQARTPLIASPRYPSLRSSARCFSERLITTKPCSAF
jgi:hypothetical protein